METVIVNEPLKEAQKELKKIARSERAIKGSWLKVATYVSLVADSTTKNEVVEAFEGVLMLFSPSYRKRVRGFLTGVYSRTNEGKLSPQDLDKLVDINLSTNELFQFITKLKNNDFPVALDIATGKIKNSSGGRTKNPTSKEGKISSSLIKLEEFQKLSGEDIARMKKELKEGILDALKKIDQGDTVTLINLYNDLKAEGLI